MWARIYCSVLLVSIVYYLFTLSFHLSNTQFTTNLQTDIFYIASIRDTELESVIRDTELESVIIVTFQNRLSYCKNARYFNNEI